MVAAVWPVTMSLSAWPRRGDLAGGGGEADALERGLLGARVAEDDVPQLAALPR